MANENELDALTGKYLETKLIEFNDLGFIDLPDGLQYSSAVLKEICLRYERDKKRLDKPNLIKQAAVISFWIKKLKPIRLFKRTPLHINEVFAFAFGQAILRKIYGCDAELVNNKLNEILYSFRYRSVTPQTLILLYEMIYQRKVA